MLNLLTVNIYLSTALSGNHSCQVGVYISQSNSVLEARLNWPVLLISWNRHKMVSLWNAKNLEVTIQSITTREDFDSRDIVIKGKASPSLQLPNRSKA